MCFGLSLWNDVPMCARFTRFSKLQKISIPR